VTGAENEKLLLPILVVRLYAALSRRLS